MWGKKSMTIVCIIWMICLKLNWFFYGLSRMLQFSQFVLTPCYFFFIALSLYPLSFFANTPFKLKVSIVYIKLSSVGVKTFECLPRMGLSRDSIQNGSSGSPSDFLSFLEQTWTGLEGYISSGSYRPIPGVFFEKKNLFESLGKIRI